MRILERIEETCKINKTDPKEVIVSFLEDWFEMVATGEAKRPDVPILSMLSCSSTPDVSDDESGNSSIRCCLYKEDVDSFFAWAFFAKDFAHLQQVRFPLFVFKFLMNPVLNSFPSRFSGSSKN